MRSAEKRNRMIPASLVLLALLIALMVSTGIGCSGTRGNQQKPRSERVSPDQEQPVGVPESTTGQGNAGQSPVLKTREEMIPKSAVKITPGEDPFPPVIHSDRWKTPVPMKGPISTAGAEDSPFITPDGKSFYFFFTPDVTVAPNKQLLDGVTGIWYSTRAGDEWRKPGRVLLNNDVALDGCPFVQGDTLWFCSARVGNYGEADLYTAAIKNGAWVEVRNAGRQLNSEYDVGEFHISADGRTFYYGGLEKGFDGVKSEDRDLYSLRKDGNKNRNNWVGPEALPPPVNDPKHNEDQPFLTSDGKELWFTGDSRMGYTGPAVFLSTREASGKWSKPEEILSNFAGEPTLDDQGNIYFVHHYFSRDLKMIEADIYVAYKK